MLQTDIISVTDPAVVTVELWRDDANNGGATPPAVPGEEGGLAVTGAQLTGLLLLGLVLVGGGALALIRRRKKKSSDSQLGDSQRGDDSQHE